MNPKKAETALRVLQRRIGAQTDVELRDGSRIRVTNASWGRDRGEDYHFVTSFPDDDGDGTAFHTNEIARLIDPLNERVIWSA